MGFCPGSRRWPVSCFPVLVLLIAGCSWLNPPTFDPEDLRDVRQDVDGVRDAMEGPCVREPVVALGLGDGTVPVEQVGSAGADQEEEGNA